MKLHSDSSAVFEHEQSAAFAGRELFSVMCSHLDSKEVLLMERSEMGLSWAGGTLVRRSVELLAFVLLVFLAAPAGAKQMAWQGTLEAQFAGYEAIISVGTGVATLDQGPPLKSLHISGNLTASGIVPITDPGITGTTKSVRFTASVKTGALSPFSPSATPQLTQNSLPMGGAVRLCMYMADCAVNLPIPFVTPKKEKGVGIGGTWTVGGYGAGIRVSVESAPWTILTAEMQVSIPTTPTGTKSEVVTASTLGFAHGPFSWAGSAGATDGIISVVVPIQVKGDIQVVGFSRLTLKFVPEPSLISLLIPGITGLLTIGVTRERILAAREARKALATRGNHRRKMS